MKPCTVPGPRYVPDSDNRQVRKALQELLALPLSNYRAFPPWRRGVSGTWYTPLTV